MKYTWDETDIFKGNRLLLTPTKPHTSTICRFSTADEYCLVLCDEIITGAWSKNKLAEYLTDMNAIPIPKNTNNTAI